MSDVDSVVKKIPLSLATSYVSSWGTWQAVRELIQNALDCEKQHIEFDTNNNKIIITSHGGTIPIKHLLLGSGTKTDDEDAIGGFSEGMKLAFLVLTRQGYFIDICNGQDKWYPSLEYSKLFDEEHLHITVKENALPERFKDKVVMTLEGFSDEEMTEIECNYIPKGYASDIKVFGSIEEGYGFNPVHQESPHYIVDAEDWSESEYENEKGAYIPKLYVGGLYICDLKAGYSGNSYRYSYNFPPNKLKLNRDRQAVETWDLQYEISKLLIKCDESSIITELGRGNSKDVEGYYKQTASSYGERSETGEHFDERLSAESYAAFQKDNPNGIPINREWGSEKKESMQRLYRQMDRYGVEVSRQFYEMMLKHIPKFEVIENVKKFEPISYLQNFLEKNKRHMRSKPRHELQTQIEYLINTKGLTQ